jgi:rubrerythrin
MGPIEALELALSKEIEAIKMYETFSFKYPETKDIFTFLQNEEERHKQLIEKRIVELQS